MTVQLCLMGKPTKEVAEELGIRAELVSRWKREYQQRKMVVFLDMEKHHLPQSKQK